MTLRHLSCFPKGTGAFFAGFALVVIGWAMTGMLLETYGLLQLFRRASHCFTRQ